MDLSIIVPTRDNAGPLVRAVQSLLAQTLASIEVIVIDDGSRDDTAQQLAALAAADPRLVVLAGGGRGVSAARNMGLAAARGDYLAFLDDDDWADAGMAASLVAAARETGAGILVAGHHVDFHDECEGLLHSERRLPPADWLADGGARQPCAAIHNQLGFVWNKLYARAMIQQAGIRFDPALSLFEDVRFNAAAFGAIGRATGPSTGGVAFVGQAFVHYVQRPRETLGNRRRPDWLERRFAAIDDGCAILQSLGVDGRAARALGLELRARSLWASLRGQTAAAGRGEALRLLPALALAAAPRGMAA